MNSSVEKTVTASYSNGRVFVACPNGVSLSFPIVGNGRLERATPVQLNNVEADDEGLHWPDLDEDLSFEGLLAGDYGQFIRCRSPMTAIPSPSFRQAM